LFGLPLRQLEAVQKDGSVLSTMIEQRRGSANHPLTNTEIKQKFRRLAAISLPTSAIDDLISVVGELDREANLHRLTALVSTRCA
jgi:hypothetical protein